MDPALQPGPALTYRLRGETHLNISNRCPARCRFCLRRTHGMFFKGRDMGLGAREPSAKALLTALEDQGGPGRTLVFSGFGEPTYRAKTLCEVGQEAARRWPAATRRLETIGLGSRINGRDIVPDLLGAVDEVRVSLNAADPQTWSELHNPWDFFRPSGYEDALGFIRACVAADLPTTVTALTLPRIDPAPIARLAKALRADFKLCALLA